MKSKLDLALITLFCAFFFLIGDLYAKNHITENKSTVSSSKTDQENPYIIHQDRFDKWAPTYDASFLQNMVFTPAHDLVIEYLGKIHPTSRILDIACGTGNLTFRLSEIANEGEVLGIDFSLEMITQAQAKLPHQGTNVTFMEGNAESLPFPDNSFDFVTCSIAFHHFPHPKKAVQEMHRVLKDGGRAIVIDNYKFIPGGIVYDWTNRTFFEKGTRLHSIKKFKSLFQEVGFEEIEQKRSFRRMHFFIPVLLTMGQTKK